MTPRHLPGSRRASGSLKLEAEQFVAVGEEPQHQGGPGVRVVGFQHVLLVEHLQRRQLGGLVDGEHLVVGKLGCLTDVDAELRQQTEGGAQLGGTGVHHFGISRQRFRQFIDMGPRIRVVFEPLGDPDPGRTNRDHQAGAVVHLRRRGYPGRGADVETLIAAAYLEAPFDENDGKRVARQHHPFVHLQVALLEEPQRRHAPGEQHRSQREHGHLDAHDIQGMPPGRFECGERGNMQILLFDVGGVLGSNGWDRNQRRRGVDHFGLDWDEFADRHDQIAESFETGRLSLDGYLDRTVFYRPRDFTTDEFSDFMRACSQPDPEALAVVADLAATGHYQLATLNNESRELNEHRIDAFELRPHFSLFLSSCYLGLRKPDLEMYRMALDITHCPPGDCVFIDDRELNIECAGDVGLDGIHFTDAATLRSDLAERGIAA